LQSSNTSNCTLNRPYHEHPSLTSFLVTKPMVHTC